MVEGNYGELPLFAQPVDTNLSHVEIHKMGFLIKSSFVENDPDGPSVEAKACLKQLDVANQ